MFIATSNLFDDSKLDKKIELFPIKENEFSA